MFLKTSRLTTTSMTICVSKQKITTITMSLHQNQCIISPSLSVHRNYITQARVLLCSIYQRPSNGHYVVLSLPKPISITTSYDLAKAELGSLRDTITARKSTEDYSLIISRWTSDGNGVDTDITPGMGELRRRMSRERPEGRGRRKLMLLLRYGRWLRWWVGRLALVRGVIGGCRWMDIKDCSMDDRGCRIRSLMRGILA
jgi:hypothetical protein